MYEIEHLISDENQKLAEYKKLIAEKVKEIAQAESDAKAIKGYTDRMKAFERLNSLQSELNGLQREYDAIIKAQNDKEAEKAKLEEEVEVIGFTNHLEVWNKGMLDETLEQKPLTNEDFEYIAELIPQGKNK